MDENTRTYIRVISWSIPFEKTHKTNRQLVLILPFNWDLSMPIQSDRQAAALQNHVSFKIAIAAFRPLAPMIPPPGCVAEPHI